MRGLLGDLRRGGDPLTAGGRLPSVTPGGAAPARSGPVVRGTGWAKEIPVGPVATPLAQAVMDGMAHQAFPHGSGNAAFRGPKPKEE
jgi:hypothetical protein